MEAVKEVILVVSMQAIIAKTMLASRGSDMAFVGPSSQDNDNDDGQGTEGEAGDLRGKCHPVSSPAGSPPTGIYCPQQSGYLDV